MINRMMLLKTFALLLSLFLWPSVAKAGNSAEHKTYQAQGRDYILHKPNAATPMPAVLVFHGGFGNASYMDRRLDIDNIANKNKFIIAYMNGNEGDHFLMKNRRTWNAGGCCGISSRKNIDDVGYINAVIHELVTKHGADPHNINLVGHSNGAMMVYRFTCEHPEKVKNAIPISGQLLVKNCVQSIDTRLIHIHGMDDLNVPFNGGIGEEGLVNFPYPSTADSIGTMRAAGAKTRVIPLEKTGHALSDVDTALLKVTGKSLPQFISDIVTGK